MPFSFSGELDSSIGAGGRLKPDTKVSTRQGRRGRLDGSANPSEESESGVAGDVDSEIESVVTLQRPTNGTLLRPADMRVQRQDTNLRYQESLNILGKARQQVAYGEIARELFENGDLLTNIVTVSDRIRTLPYSEVQDMHYIECERGCTILGFTTTIQTRMQDVRFPRTPEMYIVTYDKASITFVPTDKNRRPAGNTIQISKIVLSYMNVVQAVLTGIPFWTDRSKEIPKEDWTCAINCNTKTLELMKIVSDKVKRNTSIDSDELEAAILRNMACAVSNPALQCYIEANDEIMALEELHMSLQTVIPEASLVVSSLLGEEAKKTALEKSRADGLQRRLDAQLAQQAFASMTVGTRPSTTVFIRPTGGGQFDVMAEGPDAAAGNADARRMMERYQQPDVVPDNAGCGGWSFRRFYGR